MLIYSGYLRTRQKNCLALEEETKANINWFQRKSTELKELREYFTNYKIRNKDFGSYVNQLICSLDCRNISTSENIVSKVILKYHVSMLNLLSHVFENLFQNNSCKNNISENFKNIVSKIIFSSAWKNFKDISKATVSILSQLVIK